MITSIYKKPPVRNESELYKYITSIVGNELANISETCYMPKLTKYRKQLDDKLQTNSADINNFLMQISPKLRKFDVFREAYTITLLMSVIYYSRQHKHDLALLMYKLLAIKFYSSRIHKHLKRFCREDLWSKAMEGLSIKHLFKQKLGIANTINYLTEAEYNKYKILFNKKVIDDHHAYLAVITLRTRIAQSVRSFAQSYYRLYADKDKGISTAGGSGQTEGSGEEQSDKNRQISEQMSILMTTYGQIDSEALNRSALLSGLRKEFCVNLIREIAKQEFRDKIKFVILLMSKVQNLSTVCIENKRLLFIRKILAPTTKVGNYVVRDVIKEMVMDTGSHSVKASDISNVVLFISNYLTIFMRNRICN